MRLEEWAGTLYFIMLVITTCTNRKRQPISAKLHVASLPYADRDKLVAEWTRRLASEKALRPVTDLYAGRGFQEAVLAARRLGAELFVASAGLGLVRESATVPSYACTILANAHDSIADRVGEGFSAAAWWRQINQASPFAVSLAASVASSRGLVCAAPARVARARHDDESLRALLHQHWEAAGGSSSRLLRLFRDQLHIACEQGRFATLAREVRTERA